MNDEPARPEGHGHVACCCESEHVSERAVQEAVRVAGLSAARLSFVHVLPPPGRYTGGRTPWSPPDEVLAQELLEDARRWLEPIAARHGGDAVVIMGADLSLRMKEWAREAGCDLIVACPHTRRILGVVLGSFATGLIRDSPCPVLLVPA